MNNLVVFAQGLRKSYQTGSVNTKVLKGIDLQIQRQECVFLLGPSGSGKSTLLSILGCVLAPDEGELTLVGEDVTRFRPWQQAQFRRERIGFVFQRFHLFRGLTALENVRVPLDLLSIPRKTAIDEASRLLESVGLAEKMNSQVNQLSMGQRQRVAVARALAGDPELIFADEPTASLDAQSGLITVELLRGLAKQRGKTVIVVTHDSRILHFADRILHLRDGLIADETSPAKAGEPQVLS